jgi:Kyakuja-Dileera-Zisupton transposase
MLVRMKYPLAIVSRLLDTYGEDICLGYDIFCSFNSTLLNSCLAEQAMKCRLRGIVPGFHGYGHHLGCQVKWHPLRIDGTGKEDFEGSKRAFLASNALAIGTRLASRFHRAQAIEEHFEFWSMEKHAASGEYI